MSETMTIEDYLAQGGVLTSPANAPPRYRGELLRIMASFVDSELAGSAGFADTINGAPGIKQRIAAARIVLEKTDHAERVLTIMGTFGADTGRYATHHPWAARVARNAELSAERRAGDMRLSVFHYPLNGWTDAVTMNALMGLATVIQVKELSRVSYAPLAEAFRAIAPREGRHAELGLEGLEELARSPAGRAGAEAAITYWRPRVAATFGNPGSNRFQVQKQFGLRHTPNEELLKEWLDLASQRFGALGLNFSA